METPPPDFDLKLMPDWLKETPVKNPYADYEVREERPRRDFGERPRPPRGDQGQRRKEQRGPKPQGQKRDFPRPPRDEKSRPPRQDGPRPPVEQKPAPVRVEFLPEAIFVESVAHQIKSTGRAYPLYDLARMFLEKPSRHRVRIVSTDATAPLFQLGENGPVAFQRGALERAAFDIMRAKFYAEEKTEREPIKGNFSNVARCKLTGTWLGPTNHHGFQPALRKLYEERFSRRMPFSDFQREIETVNDPAAVEAWKQEARSVTSYRTLDEAAPVEFATAAEAEQHFRTTHLDALVHSGMSFDIPGETSRSLPDRAIANAVRQAWEKERGFPAQLMFHLRHQLVHFGLHSFKHRKRNQFISVTRPEPFKDKTFSPNIAEILRMVITVPKCTRAELAAEILGKIEDADEAAKRKAALATDLRWLLDAGRIIEFHNGRLELPLEAKLETVEAPATPVASTSAAQSTSESSAE